LPSHGRFLLFLFPEEELDLPLRLKMAIHLSRKIGEAKYSSLRTRGMTYHFQLVLKNIALHCPP